MLFLSTKTKLLACVGALVTSIVAQALPIIDLGYEIHQAIAYNGTGNYFNFSNIRYAAPPLGDLRFRAPASPTTDRGAVHRGSEPRICPQALPGWVTGLTGWVGEYLAGDNITLTQAQVNTYNGSVNAGTVPAQKAAASEDCLFLDVMVPKGIFDKANTTLKGSAVIVWIYGGGYTFGSKTNVGNPAGLLERSRTHGKRGVIYVAMNYRLGAFGWLGGSSFQADGTANAGLYDQRFALKWVQQYIHLFGGDPSRVTVFGESAGAGSIMHQITAYGGQQGAPFAQAIMQSPGFRPQTSDYQLGQQFESFLGYANVTSLDALRKLPTAALIAANTLQVFHSVYGQFVYGPSVDGGFVPALPGKLLLQGDYVKKVKVMVGHNLNEGLLFTNPLIVTNDDFEDHLRDELPQASPAVIDYIAGTLYPPIYNGTEDYTDPIGRNALETSELIFTCNTRYFGLAKKGQIFSYYFTIYPGLHGADTAYTYYNGGAASKTVLNTTAALALQDWIVTFAQGGTPLTPDVANAPQFVMYGSNATVQELSRASITHGMDSVANSRCSWWQQALYA